MNRIAATGRRIRAAGGVTRTKVRDRSRAAGRRAHDLNAKLRTRNAIAKDEALQVVRRKNAELADLAETAAAEGGGCWPTPNVPCGKPEPTRPGSRRPGL